MDVSSRFLNVSSSCLAAEFEEEVGLLDRATQEGLDKPNMKHFIYMSLALFLCRPWKCCKFFKQCTVKSEITILLFLPVLI